MIRPIYYRVFPEIFLDSFVTYTQLYIATFHFCIILMLLSTHFIENNKNLG